MPKKLLALFSVLLLTLSLLAGCGGSEPVTASSLMEEAQKYTDEADSMKTHMLMDMTMSGESLQTVGGSVEMAMDIDMDTVKDPLANHMTGKVKFLGMDMDYEAYSVLEDDQMCTYSKVMGSWTLQKTDLDKEALEEIKKGSSAQFFSQNDQFTLQEETEDVDGTEAYIITGTLEGEDIKSLMENFSGALPAMGIDMSDVDYKDVSVDIKYAIAKEDRRPVYVDADFKGMESMMGDAAEGITIDKFTLHLDYLDFNNVDSIEVPQEAIDQAVDSSAASSTQTQ